MATTAALPWLGVLGLAGAFGVGMILILAGLTKLRQRPLMVGVVANYRLLPEALVAPVATALPVAELVLGVALLAGGMRIAVLPAALLLMLFAAAMAINIRRGRSHIDCGCGGPHGRQTLGWPLVLRNLALAAIVLVRLVPVPVAGAVALAVALFGGTSLFLLTLLSNAFGTLAASPFAVKRS